VVRVVAGLVQVPDELGADVRVRIATCRSI
jgi:hypothetical protein